MPEVLLEPFFRNDTKETYFCLINIHYVMHLRD
jgi:hypothetical protein